MCTTAEKLPDDGAWPCLKVMSTFDLTVKLDFLRLRLQGQQSNKKDRKGFHRVDSITLIGAQGQFRLC
jgi:hypothetical protein